MNKIENIKYWNLSFYILGIIPAVFIISSLTFYIYYRLILGFGGISSINPNEFPAPNIYAHIIIYSWTVTLFSVLIFIASIFYSIIKNKHRELRRLIFIDLAIYLVAIVLVFSKIFESTID